MQDFPEGHQTQQGVLPIIWYLFLLKIAWKLNTLKKESATAHTHTHTHTFFSGKSRISKRGTKPSKECNLLFGTFLLKLKYIEERIYHCTHTHTHTHTQTYFFSGEFQRGTKPSKECNLLFGNISSENCMEMKYIEERICHCTHTHTHNEYLAVHIASVWSGCIVTSLSSSHLTAYPSNRPPSSNQTSSCCDSDCTMICANTAWQQTARERRIPFSVIISTQVAELHWSHFFDTLYKILAQFGWDPHSTRTTYKNSLQIYVVIRIVPFFTSRNWQVGIPHKFFIIIFVLRQLSFPNFAN